MPPSDPSAPSTPPAGDAKPAIAASPFGQVPIEITVSVGRARPMIKELLDLGPEAVLPLDRRIDDPVELFIGDRLIARGVLSELDGDREGQLAVCLTEVSDLEKGI